jgi:hypothetical protein
MAKYLYDWFGTYKYTRKFLLLLLVSLWVGVIIVGLQISVLGDIICIPVAGFFTIWIAYSLFKGPKKVEE